MCSISTEIFVQVILHVELIIEGEGYSGCYSEVSHLSVVV
jgi:hypothetical protein